VKIIQIFSLETSIGSRSNVLKFLEYSQKNSKYSDYELYLMTHPTAYTANLKKETFEMRSTTLRISKLVLHFISTYNPLDDSKKHDPR